MMAEAAVESPQPETSAGSGVALMRSAPNNECSPSPPPNCAICLGNCINKCFSDSCMHQFCFNCLLEWSKVKAVCPLCKQPFKSIIHNVKSNNEYDQHFIPQQETRFEDMLWRDSARHFQFRTTLTVDPHGELAIQHLLSTRAMTNSLPHTHTRMNVVRHIGDYLRSHRNRNVSSSQYRRSLYERNLYTHPMTDVTGRYRETSPSFYREYPGSKNRLVPFLQREVNALLESERSLHAMNLVHRILAAIDDHPIRGRYMKNMLRPEMGAYTDHFLYEFYTYARSPYDLYGYDRSAQVLPRESTLTEDSSDSDVFIVSVERAPGRLNSNEVIEIGSESSHDSDVVIREPTPPVLVDLANTTSTSDEYVQAVGDNQPQTATTSQVQPLDIVLPEHQMTAKVRQLRRQLRKRRHLERLPSTSEPGDSTSSSEEDYRERSRKRPLTIKPRKYRSSQEEEDSSSDDNIRRAKRKKLRKRKPNSNRKHEQPIQEHPEAETARRYLPTLTAFASTSQIKNENEHDQDNVNNYQVPRPEESLNELYQRTSLGGVNMSMNLNPWLLDYNDPNVFVAMQPAGYPKLPPYFHGALIPTTSSMRCPDEAGPSGMRSNPISWEHKQPKPGSDTD